MTLICDLVFVSMGEKILITVIEFREETERKREREKKQNREDRRKEKRNRHVNKNANRHINKNANYKTKHDPKTNYK